VKKQKGAQQLSFADDGAGGDDAPEPDDNAAIAMLSANFAALGGCARAEAARSSSFRGVTLQFRWLPSGKAENATVKEPALKGAPVARCLQQAVEAIRLPRFSGEPRTIEYPIRVK
jgi:hypothetical protein